MSVPGRSLFFFTWVLLKNNKTHIYLDMSVQRNKREQTPCVKYLDCASAKLELACVGWY